MNESIQVKPRYREPDAPLLDDLHNNLIYDKVAQPPNNGSFMNTLYENKVIILIIIVIVIIIGIIAYFAYRKTDEPSKMQHQNNQPKSSETPLVKELSKQSRENQLTGPPVISEQPTAVLVTEPVLDKMNKSNIAALLSQSRNKVVRKTEEVTYVDDSSSKSEEEILQLMEDENNTNDGIVTEEEKNVDVTQIE